MVVSLPASGRGELARDHLIEHSRISEPPDESSLFGANGVGGVAVGIDDRWEGRGQQNTHGRRGKRGRGVGATGGDVRRGVSAEMRFGAVDWQCIKSQILRAGARQNPCSNAGAAARATQEPLAKANRQAKSAPALKFP